MTVFLNNQYDFKSAVYDLRNLLNHQRKSGLISENNIVDFLFTLNKKAEINWVFKESKKIFSEVNKIQTEKYSIGQIQQILSRSLFGYPYQVFKSKTFEHALDFWRLFEYPNILTSNGLDKGQIMVHLYPLEFNNFEVLNPWRVMWHEMAESKFDQPFFPPLPPAECFEGKNVHTELYRDWVDPNDKEFQNGTAGALVYSNERCIGCVKWNWWGSNTLNGSDFSLVFFHEDNLIYLGFDIRPHNKDVYVLGAEAIPRQSEKAQDLFSIYMREIKDIRFISESEQI